MIYWHQLNEWRYWIPLALRGVQSSYKHNEDVSSSKLKVNMISGLFSLRNRFVRFLGKTLFLMSWMKITKMGVVLADSVCYIACLH